MTAFDQPVVGFRVWALTDNPWDRHASPDGLLRSLGSDHLWCHATMEAECLKDRFHEAPEPDCSCGLYAYDRLETTKLHEDELNPASTRLLALGAVLLWGRVAHAEVADRYGSSLRGPNLGLRLRAQYGRILALRDGGRVTEPACRLHRIPSVSERYLEAFAREHGDQIRAAFDHRLRLEQIRVRESVEMLERWTGGWLP